MKSAMHPEAREEFLAAIDYYNEAEPGLGMAFYSEVEVAIGLIENYPDLWTEIADNIRRCHEGRADDSRRYRQDDLRKVETRTPAFLRRRTLGRFRKVLRKDTRAKGICRTRSTRQETTDKWLTKL